jgi:uncharacterized protein YndB with AHSA1/START domain
MTDIRQEINVVRRQVGTRMLESGEAGVVTISRAYDAGVDEVWDACTNPQRIPRWFIPVSGELREGGRFQLEGNASGTIERCDPPKGFTATWEYGGGVSWIELRLTARPQGGTLLELDHIARADEHWEQFGPGAVGIGWDMGLFGLARHLSHGPAAAAVPDAAAWLASEEGQQFIKLSNEGWRDADIESGTGKAVARAAADRTLAAYTGSPG